MPDRKFHFSFHKHKFISHPQKKSFNSLHADNVSDELDLHGLFLEEQQLAVIVGGDILSFQRRMNIFHHKMKQHFQQYSGVSDVIRIHLERWIRTFDEPIKDVVTLNDDADIQTMKASRIYVVYGSSECTKKVKSIHHFSYIKYHSLKKALLPYKQWMLDPNTIDLFGEDSSEEDSEDFLNTEEIDIQSHSNENSEKLSQATIDTIHHSESVDEQEIIPNITSEKLKSHQK